MPGISASPCRPALTVLCHHFGVPSSLLRHLGTGSGMEPCPTSSSDCVINTKHITQLSCLHAQSFKFLTCVRLGQALYFFGKKLLVKFFPCRNFVRTHLTRYPRSLYLGASLTEAYLYGPHAQDVRHTSACIFYSPLYASI